MSAPNVKAIFDRAMEIESPADREAYLNSACAGHPEVRQRVLALLRAAADAGSFLEVPLAAAVQATAEFTPNSEVTRNIARPVEPIDLVIAGRYQLLNLIGEGGMGSVYRAQQTEPVKREVAVKVIKAGMDSKGVLARFDAERQAIAVMDHPHIARLFDAGSTDKGQPFFVMELVKGLPLTDYCDQHKLSVAERLQLFLQICSAVQHAHQKGIIHRDLKPTNILVETQDGRPVPKVIDFGLAKATSGLPLAEGAMLTLFGNVMGTPTYMAPEQATFEALDVDTRADIYSLGVILYELLTGSTPLSRATMKQAAVEEMLKLIREQETPKPSSRFQDKVSSAEIAARRCLDSVQLARILRGDLDWIVLKALEKNRSRRYATAGDLAADILRHLQHEPITARPPSNLYRLQKICQRNKLAVATVGAVAASLILGIALSLWQATRATIAERRAVAALNELRETAPAFAEQARALTAQEKFSEAVAKIDYAIKLRPDLADYLITKGDLLQSQLQLAAAADVYRAALRLDPKSTRAQESIKICDELLAAKPTAEGKLTNESLAKLRALMQRQKRSAAELMPVARLLDNEQNLLVEYWLKKLENLPVAGERPLRNRIKALADGRLALDLRETQLTDISALAGAPLGLLDLSESQFQGKLSDISPLRGMELEELNINNTSVADLSPLREMRTLKKLGISQTKVTSLADLADMQLNTLYMKNCAISDLSPLRGMPLETLDLHASRVTDLTPLVGLPINDLDLSFTGIVDFAPVAQLSQLEHCKLQRNRISDLTVFRGLKNLKTLALWMCADARNYRVLQEIKTLENLLLPIEYRNLPIEDYEAIGQLQQHPNLKRLAANITAQSTLNEIGPKEEFWKDWEREKSFILPLRKAGIQFTCAKLPSGKYYVGIKDSGLTDLAMFKGAPIEQLHIVSELVNDLSPLAGMPLETLFIVGDFADLSPLRGMPLKNLEMGGLKVTDFSPLAELPLRELCVQFCVNASDVAPLAKIASLELLMLPPNAVNFDLLQSHPKLTRIGYEFGGDHSPKTTTAEFWKLYGEESWLGQVRKSGVKINSLRWHPDGTWNIDVANQPLTDLSIFKDAPLNSLGIDNTKVTDLSPLKGQKLKVLYARDTPLKDLSPLQGMPCTALWLSGSQVDDLSPLRDMPLKNLYLNRTKVADVSPLRGMPLQYLEIVYSQLTDLEPLRDMPLRDLALNGTKITDLSPLVGSPLTRLRLTGCQGLTDMSPLEQMKELVDLSLPPRAGKFEFLRTRPNLARIAFTEDPANGYKPATTAQQFWKEYDTQAWLHPLRDQGFLRGSKQFPDGTWQLILDNAQLTDLKPLSGQPISDLSLGATPITDLTPLKGLPLKSLDLKNTPVTDLSPLKDLKLELLSLRGAKVKDLSPLRGLPLKSLWLSGCKELTDLSPLAECEELTAITLPPKAKDFEFLRKLPKLERISFREETKPAIRPAQTAAEFWMERDSMK
ncbi:protein kinase domain-containing protein [Anatilimnocola floriformis]|uniref:protein kinase domain-containing protein n=1 Tax=Anatilimnocola floriformis TaxID=2948575 RepID=UPI0020C43664|nr:protein kinase [Anatilimnocola floriformis]